ncbi:AAEL005670-PA [Aedes aegypti]|uniref:AAEL005670-PA n=1 Tax=Aedes aegypti TaxID=7159 RepID=Q179D8_AEDAE|nr:AAEL005670-PA [Aedes aegypti]
MPAQCPRFGQSAVHMGVALLFLLNTSATLRNVGNHRSNQLQNQPDAVLLNNDLDWKLVKEVFHHEQKNVIFSPFSIKLLLSLLYEASKEHSKTRQELSLVLAGSDLEKNRLLYQEFLESSTKENSNYQFNVGTRIFTDQRAANVSDAYSDLVQNCYKTSIESVEFDSPKETSSKINEWCFNITNGHLKDLVDEELIKDSVMVIVNALFLKASWRNSFKEELNRKRNFYVSENTTVEAEFMEQTDIYQYLDDPDMQLEMVRLPYKGRHFSMTIVLPYANRSLGKMVESLTDQNLLKLESNLQRDEIVVIIPKYKFDYSTTLNDVLIRLGITEVFTDKAELPELSGGKNSTLAVSKMLQKAGIEVNEKGTLAFAATEIQLVNKFGIDDMPIQFKANRPFMFYIKDEDSDAVLFVGKVENPVATEKLP